MDESGVIAYEIPEGGFRYRFLKTGLDRLNDYGAVREDGYVIPMAWSLRSGCAVATKWVPIEHAAGLLTFYPHLTAAWRGELLEGPDNAPLFNFRMEVRKANGVSRTYRRYLDTSHMQLTLRATGPDGWKSYAGHLSNPAADGTDETFGNSLAVEPGDAVRLLLCDIWQGVTVTIHDIDAYSIPVSQ